MMIHSNSIPSSLPQFIADTVGCMGWVVMGSRPCVFIRDSYEKGKRHVRDIKTYQVSGHPQTKPAVRRGGLDNP